MIHCRVWNMMTSKYFNTLFQTRLLIHGFCDYGVSYTLGMLNASGAAPMRKTGSAIPISCSGHGDAPLKLVDFGIAGVLRRRNSTEGRDGGATRLQTSHGSGWHG